MFSISQLYFSRKQCNNVLPCSHTEMGELYFPFYKLKERPFISSSPPRPSGILHRWWYFEGMRAPPRLARWWTQPRCAARWVLHMNLCMSLTHTHTHPAWVTTGVKKALWTHTYRSADDHAHIHMQTCRYSSQQSCRLLQKTTTPPPSPHQHIHTSAYVTANTLNAIKFSATQSHRYTEVPQHKNKYRSPHTYRCIYIQTSTHIQTHISRHPHATTIYLSSWHLYAK